MIGKVDLVMWTKNGERTLSEVLKRIDEVIPYENVCHKILIDDHSVDRTVEIAKEFNWNVYSNPTTGIASGANEALRHVDSDFFISVEQDVVLAKNWWEKIPNYLENPTVVCAQGIRVTSNRTLRKLEEYTNQKRIAKGKLIYVSIDNNIFRTKLIKELGGFPTDCPRCVDTILMKRILYETPYKWIVDKNVVSLHIRQSIRHEIRHQYTYGVLCTNTPYCWEPPTSMITNIRMLITSPLSALRIALIKNEPNILWTYPILRFTALKTSLERRKFKAER